MPSSHATIPVQQNPIHKGAKVTFKNLSDPVMIIEALDWAANTAVCRYKDPIAKKTIHLTCDPNDLAAATSRQSG